MANRLTKTFLGDVLRSGDFLWCCWSLCRRCGRVMPASGQDRFRQWCWGHCEPSPVAGINKGILWVGMPFNVQPLGTTSSAPALRHRLPPELNTIIYTWQYMPQYDRCRLRNVGFRLS
jgi:hypothetical protein